VRMLSKNRKRKRERGVAAVEFALILPVFLALVLGAIDFGYFFYVTEVVTNAAREGARAGSVVDPGNGSTGAITTAETAAEQKVKAYLDHGLLHSDSSVVVNADASYSNLTHDGSITVTIDYPVGSMTGFFPTSIIPAFAKARAVMRWQ
jgi:Flp pilus assembly protein TadG